MQPRELVARWQEEARQLRKAAVELDDRNFLLGAREAETAAETTDECASDLEAALAEQDGGWMPAREASIRDLAVAIVDLSCGYTMEFAPSPSQHRSTYDFVEEKIRAEIKYALAEQDVDALRPYLSFKDAELVAAWWRGELAEFLKKYGDGYPAEAHGDGWLPLAEAPLGVPLEVWGPKLPGSPASPESARWYPSGGKVMYAMINDEGGRGWTKGVGFTHARLVTPPPCA